MPIALISLVDDDRQWFKSPHGIDADGDAARHGVLRPRDPRTTASSRCPTPSTTPASPTIPLVTDDPRVRFYAGAPLTLSDGTRPGTLCVIDHRPRLLEDDQLAELRRLAALVAEELEA